MMKKFFIITALMTGLILIFNSAAEAQMKTVVSFTGSVFNAITKDPVRIKYKLIDDEGKTKGRGKTNAAQNGYYFITGLFPGKTYSLIFEGDDNYFGSEFKIDIPNTDKYQEFSKDFLVSPKLKGVELPQRVAVFELNKTKLRGGADFFLDDVLKTLKENKTIKFTVVSYPDNNKDDVVNEALTKARSQALQDYFVSKGIDKGRINIKPNKSTDPKNPPPTEKRAKGKRYIGSVYYMINEY